MEVAFIHLQDLTKQDKPLLSQEIKDIWGEFVDVSADPTVEDLQEFLQEFDKAIYTSERYEILNRRFHHEVKQAKSLKVQPAQYSFRTATPSLEQVRQVYAALYEDMATLGELREALADAIKDFRSESNKFNGLYNSLQQFVRDPNTCSDLRQNTERDRLFNMCTPQMAYLKSTLQAYVEDLARFLESVVSKIFQLARMDSHVKTFIGTQELETLGVHAGGTQSGLWEAGAVGVVPQARQAIPSYEEFNPQPPANVVDSTGLARPAVNNPFAMKAVL